jgi:hypothetical protein
MASRCWNAARVEIGLFRRLFDADASLIARINANRRDISSTRVNQQRESFACWYSLPDLPVVMF